MIEVKYQVEHAPSIVSQIARHLDLKSENGRYLYEKNNISICITTLQLNDHVSCMISEFKSKDHLRVSRVAGG